MMLVQWYWLYRTLINMQVKSRFKSHDFFKKNHMIYITTNLPCADYFVCKKSIRNTYSYKIFNVFQ